MALTLGLENLQFMDMASIIDQGISLPRLWYILKSVWEWITLSGSYKMPLLIVAI